MNRFSNESDAKNQDEELQKYVSSKEESIRLISRLTASLISTILYSRQAFDEKFFFSKNFGKFCFYNFKYKIQKENANEEESANKEAINDIINLIHGTVDVLRRKYLKKAVIGIYEDLDKPNEFLETYEFHYTYHETKSKLETSDCGPATHARSQIEDLLEKVFSNCRTMKPLPNNWYFTIIIFYCENSKPQEYQPEFFKAGTYPVRECYHKTNIELGRVDTPYHSIKIEFDSVKESEK